MQYFSTLPIGDLELLAQKVQPSTRAMFARLQKKKNRKLDDVVHEIHEEVMNSFDCLTCANCCKTISPRMGYMDVERMAKALKIKPSALVQKYMQVDVDGDYVFTQAPCPFLMADNYCIVYENRPKACREYPHTDRKRFYQIFDLTLKNTYICPVAYQVVESLKTKF